MALRQRPTAVRPEPDWDLVLKRNSIERLKRERFPLDVRDELPRLIELGYEAVPEEDIVRLNWWGLTHDKPKVGTFMVRIKVPGGLIRPAQLRAVGEIARRYGRDEAELTTRQGIQLHWVRLDQLPEVLAAIEAAGLTTVGGEGDTVRNITGCPVAGIDPDELFDVRPVIEEAARFFYGNRDYSNLPRKHKYTISACPAQCNAPEIHDVALVGTRKDGRDGFALRVGGGMSNTPRISRDLGVFVPVEDAIDVLRAVTDAWQSDLRYRVSRAKARIKFMVDDLGPEGMRRRVEERLGRPLEDGAAPEPAGSADHLGVHPQRQEGLVYVGIPVPVGRVTGEQLVRLADLLEDLGADLRFTRQQNAIAGNVPEGRLDDLRRGLAELGLPLDRPAFARAVACTSHRFCNYSVAETKEKLAEVIPRLEARFGAEAVAGLTIHMDGCPHACAQHWIGEIGLQGTTAPSPDGAGRVEAYDVTLGGGLGRRARIGRPVLRRVPAEELDAVLERLVGAWLEARTARPDLGFGDFVDARGDEELAALARGEDAPAPGPTAAAGVAIHVPGPLLHLVGGADQIEVRAATVREALAQVARDHPAFAREVLPGGDLAEAYLVFLGEEDVRALRGLDTPVRPGDRITILVAMSGG
ncbi:MAG TPA: MoaD/ThiS family protein [Actinomycetota bacterium]|nr:MoaD/ThiS family protein [Actinomycetota bacterium]